MVLNWGLLGPSELASERRVRTLGVSASVRHFNELAVPGLGGVWFGKQVMLATLGVKVAQKAREQRRQVTNIETANAIEALACWLGFDLHGWQARPRLRGVNKMRGVKGEGLTFRRMREHKFYVTQPMRMSTVETLPALGLVDAPGSRFNTFVCNEAGDVFVTAACGGARPKNRPLVDHLVDWIGTHEPIGSASTLRTLASALMPTLPLPERARALLTERLRSRNHGETSDEQRRRGDALDWVESIRLAPSAALGWAEQPREITSALHWSDLRAGALFTLARDAALEVLDALEAQIRENGKGGKGEALSLRHEFPDSTRSKLGKLRAAAQSFRNEGRSEVEANRFCRDCLLPDDKSLAAALVERDGRVLRLRGDDVVPGSAYRTAEPSAVGASGNENNAEDAAPETSIVWPVAISFRMRNLFLLNADLRGDLERWLNRADTAAALDEGLMEEAT